MMAARWSDSPQDNEEHKLTAVTPSHQVGLWIDRSACAAAGRLPLELLCSVCVPPFFDCKTQDVIFDSFWPCGREL